MAKDGDDHGERLVPMTLSSLAKHDIAIKRMNRQVFLNTQLLEVHTTYGSLGMNTIGVLAVWCTTTKWCRPTSAMESSFVEEGSGVGVVPVTGVPRRLANAGDFQANPLHHKGKGVGGKYKDEGSRQAFIAVKDTMTGHFLVHHPGDTIRGSKGAKEIRCQIFAPW